MRQDAGKDLARPLVGQGLVLGTIDAGALKLRRIVVGDVVIEALATVTVGTTGDVDDHAALGKRGLGSAHALHGLVDVLVERVAAVGGDGDLALDGLNAGKALHELAAGLVRLVDVAGKGADDLVLAIEHHVEHKGKVSHLGGGEHVLTHVVVAQVAGTRVGIVHKLTVVVVHDGLVAGDARQDGLAATRETGKEVRLNKALGKQQIAIGRNLVDDALATRRQGADLFHHAVVSRDVHNDFLVGNDLLAVLVDELLVRRRTMHTRSNQNANARLRRSGMDVMQQNRHRHTRGNGTRMIGANDDNILLASTKLLERRRAVRVGKRLLHQLFLRFRGLKLVLMTFHHTREVLILEFQMQRLVVKRQFTFKQCRAPSSFQLTH